MDTAAVKRVLDSDIGKPLKRYLLSALEELKDIENLEDLTTPTHLAIEVKAQKKAYKKLQEILGFILTIEKVPVGKSGKSEYSVD